MAEIKSVGLVVTENETMATSTAQAPMFRASECTLANLCLYGADLGARYLLDFLMNAVLRTITTVITTHPFVPNFAGEVDFSPIKLGPVTTFWAHSGR